jgi:ribonuclease-3
MDPKFKSNPYNSFNSEIDEITILNILKNHNIQDYQINNLPLFQKAFVHNSYCFMQEYKEYTKPDNCLPLYTKSYETLEFLGDSILGSIITKYLYNRYTIHNQNEGFLTKLKIRFICGEQLAFLSKQNNFNKFMIISKHIEDNCSGRKNEHILEDIFEAFIGALYLDSNNWDIVEQFIISNIESYIDIVDLILFDNNYKDQLLRYLQHNYSVHPKYETIKTNNDNFESIIYRIDNENSERIEIGKGYGSTKKKSEQQAAKDSLIKYSVISK